MHLYARSDRKPAEALSHDERLDTLTRIAEAYASVESGSDFFEAPPMRDVHVHKVRSVAKAAKRALRVGTPSDTPPCRELSLNQAGVYDLAWPSTYRVWLEAAREAYERRIENRTAYARLYLGGGPRPMLIVLHGYMGGNFAFEERAWPVEWLMKRGLDVAIFVLPFHGRRGRQGPPPLPSADPRLTNEGLGQAIVDLRALIGWVRARGAPHVGLVGMSLGGYTASLAATIEPDLAILMALLPLASIADFARDQGRLGADHETPAQHAALERANFIVSPFARAPRIAPERVLIVAGESDRVTPRAHAQRLAEHFHTQVVTMPGGHLLQFGRNAAFTALETRLVELGLAKPPGSFAL
jgi:pimeloyl-ACP methyl ester carboxylesterase